MDYDTKKNLFRVAVIISGLYCIFPQELGPILNYQLIDSVPFLVPRVVVGIASAVFAIGSWKRWW